MHVEISYFFIFQNTLRSTNNFRNDRDFFEVLSSTFFYKMSGTLNEVFFTWSLLKLDIFSQKSQFLYSKKSQV